MPDISGRLRDVSARISKIDRSIGMLRSRVYFQPAGGVTEEVLITEFKDNGVNEKPLSTGESVAGHRFTIQVNLNWVDAHAGQAGQWSVTRDNDPTPILCEKESETFQDEDTEATIVLRVSQSVGDSYAAIG